jgi:outer membrane protein
MKRLTVIIIAVCAVLCASAQQDSTRQLRYGYLSYDSVLVAMPGYALVQNTLAAMRSQYEAEMKRVEQDFNLKYEEFLDGQRDFPPTILRKRQTELKELLERNVSFKAVSRQELAEAEVRAMAPLRERLSQTLDQIGRERGYAFILNTDAGAVPFINPAVGEDITQLVLNAFR